MQVYHFFTEGDYRRDKFEYVAIQGKSDSKFKIPVYRKESDGKFHKVDCLFYPSLTKFIPIEIKFYGDLTVDQIEHQFGDISALPW